MDVTSLLARAGSEKTCLVYPSAGIPAVDGIELPEDLRRFYAQCGGLDLFREGDHPISVVRPCRFRRSNPAIAGVEGRDDISYAWFIIAEEGQQFVTMDCHPDRLGRCYDSFWDRHAIVGSSLVIARSFTELLERLLEAKGRRPYWLEPGAVTYGDAYDA